MRRVLLIFIFHNSLLLAGYSQSIPSLLRHVNGFDDLYLVRTNNVEQIIAKRTVYYRTGGKLKEKSVLNFVDSLKISGQLFKDEQLNSNFEYEFDTFGSLIKIIISTKQPLIGWQSRIITYEYEVGNLKYEKEYNKDMQLLGYVKFEYNTDNRPVKMSMYNALDELTAYETADYDESKMLYYYKVFNSTGSLISEDTEYFNSDVSCNLTNKYGDLVLFKCPWSNSEKNIFYQLEYKYDDKGNWIERKWFILDGKLKEKMSVTLRNIKYLSLN